MAETKITEKTAYIIWSNGLGDWATKTTYPKHMDIADFNVWVCGFLACSTELRDKGINTQILNVIAEDELSADKSISEYERKAICELNSHKAKET